MNLHSYSRLDTRTQDAPESSQIAPQAPNEQALDLDTIIKRYLAGESMQTLAAETGKHRATLYRWMLAGLGDENYHDLVTDCLVTRIAQADHKLETAKDGCDIARAREMAKFARMDFERRRPKLYGIKQDVTVTHLDLGDRLRRAKERVIEGTTLIEGPNQTKKEPGV